MPGCGFSNLSMGQYVDILYSMQRSCIITYIILYIYYDTCIHVNLKYVSITYIREVSGELWTRPTRDGQNVSKSFRIPSPPECEGESTMEKKTPIYSHSQAVVQVFSCGFMLLPHQKMGFA